MATRCALALLGSMTTMLVASAAFAQEAPTTSPTTLPPLPGPSAAPAPAPAPQPQPTTPYIIIVPAPAPPQPIVVAAPPPPPRVEERDLPTESRWYGWQNLLVDGGSVVLGVALRSPAAFAASYALGGPIVHWAHGHVGKGFASLGLRVGLPFVAGLIGFAIDASSHNCHSSDFCVDGLAGLVVGSFLGYVGAVVVDSAALANERVPREPPPPPQSSGVHLQPYFSLTKTGGGTGGIGGVF